MAWIERRRGTWYLIWREGGRGTRKRKVRIGTKRQDATTALALHEHRRLSAALGGTAPPPAMSFVAFSEQWLATRLCRPKTAALERMLLRVHLVPEFGGAALTTIGPHAIDAFLARLTGKVSAQTARRTWTVMRRMLTDAKRWGLLWSNPSHDVQPPRVPYVPAHSLDVEALVRVLHATPERWRPLILTAALTGLRWGEVTALEGRDIDPGLRWLDVRRSRPAGWDLVGEPKSRSALRRVDLLPPVQEIFEKILTVMRRSAGEVIFTGVKGGHLNHRWFLKRVWRPVTLTANVPGTKFHGLRHTYASLMLAWGEPILYVAQQLGHARPSITLDVYGHLMHEGRRLDKVSTLRLLSNVQELHNAPEARELVAAP